METVAPNVAPGEGLEEAYKEISSAVARLLQDADTESSITR